jgi:hypothetical protein
MLELLAAALNVDHDGPAHGRERMLVIISLPASKKVCA